MQFVLDNSVVMRWLFADGSQDDQTYAAQVLTVLAEGMAFVPNLWSLEVANVIVRAEAKKLLTESRSAEFIQILERMNIQVDNATYSKALTDTLQLARRYNLSSYDASYLELALRKGLPLATLDKQLQDAVSFSGLKPFI
jgi:predicted nucleic acid-binding protein